ncbi:MAG: dipeptidase [Pseudomonadaceae bacterium]|nr:dipeptidase [Pseudomonadaceae bacterium]
MMNASQSIQGIARPLLLLSLALGIAACNTVPTSSAESLARSALIVDTHIDVPYRLYRNYEDVSVATESGDFDYPRAETGGLDALFMSIYIPAGRDAAGEAGDMADELIDLVEGLVEASPDKFGLAWCADDVDALKAQGRIAFPLGMENGGPVAGSIDELKRYFDRGIRYITLAHSKSNHISDSSYDVNERWQGLSPFGKELIGHMNRLGVMVDISHLSDKAAWQVLEFSEVPVIASHSSLRHFTPDWQRNMSDEMVQALTANGGVIQINYGSSFLTSAARAWGNKASAQALLYQTRLGITESSDPRMQDFWREHRAANPYPFADISDVLDHIDRAVDLAGIDHVGLGSDYDGVADTLPTGLKDVASYPNLVAGLRERGYADADIVKILGANVMRVWRANEAYAAAAGQPVQCAVR